MRWERKGIHRKIGSVSNILALGVGSKFVDVYIIRCYNFIMYLFFSSSNTVKYPFLGNSSFTEKIIRNFKICVMIKIYSKIVVRGKMYGLKVLTLGKKT